MDWKYDKEDLWIRETQKQSFFWDNDMEDEDEEMQCNKKKLYRYWKMRVWGRKRR